MLRILLATLALALPLSTAHAQTWPEKPIRIIVPVPAGGPTDIVARLIAQQFKESAGWTTVVENITGGGATIGTAEVAAADPDGYTLLLASTGPMVVSIHMQRNLSYDPSRFAPIIELVRMPNILVANTKVPIKSIKDLVAYAKANPGKITYASTGLGNSTHLSGEILKRALGIQMQHVPYRGSAQSLPEILAGRVTLSFDPIAATLEQSRTGDVSAIGVTSAERSPSAPEIPTIAEQGVKDYNVVVWYGMAAPAGTPKEIIDRINSEAEKALKVPAVRDKLLSLGATPTGGTSEYFTKVIADEVPMWKRVVEEAGLQEK